MFIFMMYILSGLFLVTGLYNLADYVLVFPSGNTKNAFRYLRGRKDIKKKLYESVIQPFARWIERFLNMSAYKRRRLVSELDQLDIKKTPEQFVSENLSRSILLALIGIIFVPMGIPIVSALVWVLAVVLYSKESQKIRKQIEVVRRQIESELPRMVETLNYTMEDNNDLIRFFERYRKVSGKAMGRALDRLLLDMKTGNAEQALREFDSRLNIPQVSAFVSALLSVSYGVDQRTVLIVMEKDLRGRQRELMRREIDKRPGKVKLASIILTLMMILLMMAPLVVMIVQTFQGAGFVG